MISRTPCILFVAVALGLRAAPALAERRGGASPGCGPGGCGRQRACLRHFDPGRVEKLSGEIVSLQTFRPMRGVSDGVHLDLKTKREKVSVHLGPAWYIDNQVPPLQVGDKVDVTGARISIDAKPAIIASEIQRGDEALKLRDTDGYPLWCGWRRR